VPEFSIVHCARAVPAANKMNASRAAVRFIPNSLGHKTELFLSQPRNSLHPIRHFTAD
jgi:hypothetical protein